MSDPISVPFGDRSSIVRAFKKEGWLSSYDSETSDYTLEWYDGENRSAAVLRLDGSISVFFSSGKSGGSITIPAGLSPEKSAEKATGFARRA